MKRFLLVAGVSLAIGAFAATKPTGVKWLEWFQKGVFIGSTANQSDNHMITNSLATAGATAAQVNVSTVTSGTCADSAAVTLTGAKAGDTCVLGLPSLVIVATDGGASAGSWGCVALTDSVKVRFCNPSAVDIDPVDAGFTFRTFSNQ